MCDATILWWCVIILSGFTKVFTRKKEYSAIDIPSPQDIIKC